MSAPQTRDNTKKTAMHADALENQVIQDASRLIPPDFSENALKVLEKRYLKKSEDENRMEAPHEMLLRVAHNIAQAERLYDKQADIEKMTERFYNMISTRCFFPNSPTLMNAGKLLQQLSACFVLPVEDSMESIFEAIKNTALIHKSGGGTGFSFSRIRPSRDVVQTTQGVSSGPISFLTVFDAATETIKQGGTRRGANMGILRIDHPDIIDFINAKINTDKLNNFNISVALTKEFWEALKGNTDYPLINPRTRKVTGRLKAGEVFDLIVHNAWENGEPGIIFLDRINEHNPTPQVGEIESTNPCGEQPLLPYESCNLGSINLSEMVTVSDSTPKIDYAKLEETVQLAVRFLDNVIDMNHYPLKKIKDMTLANRKIGLGVMGFADMLIALGVPYNSDDACTVAEKVMRFISTKSKETSHELANRRGVFPNFDKSSYNKNGKYAMRNATTTTIAPTGTISILGNCSSGIEPLFAVAFVRCVMDNDRLVEVHPLFQKIARERNFYSKELMHKIVESGSLQDIEDIPEDMRKIFITSHDVTPEWHVRIQAAFQKYTDNAVSKTVNFQNSATDSDVRRVYELAYELGCKGVTIYRDGSRKQQVLTKGVQEEKSEEGADSKITPRSRPDRTYGFTEKIGTGCGNLYITINCDEEGPNEIFTQMGKSGGCAASQSEATGRLVSLALRSGISIKAIVEQLKGIRCPSPRWYKGNLVLSCSDGIGKVLEAYYDESSQSPDGNVKQLSLKNSIGLCPECPDCGNMLEFSEGCVICKACGYTKC